MSSRNVCEKTSRFMKYQMDKLRPNKLNNLKTLQNNYIVEEVYGLVEKKKPKSNNLYKYIIIMMKSKDKSE
jgi:hypothetical protein